MNRPVSVRATAESDLAEAFDWYESQRAGLGEEFLTDFEHTQSTIRVKKGVRKKWAVWLNHPEALDFPSL